MAKIRIVVSGAKGRMGRRITALARKDPDIEVAAGVEITADPGLNITADLSGIKKPYDCIIEFTTPEATVKHIQAAKKLGKAVVIGTTGLSDAEKKAVLDASRSIPVVFSPNMSVGVNVLFALMKKASHALGKIYEIRIKEAHHVHKKDKPSGTAKLMAEIVKNELPGIKIPIEAIREDEIVGDHDVTFESKVDIFKISHSAKTRDIFALGALKAAKFVSAKKKGLFSMADVLELKEK